jgi:ribulose-phosphate 3-epimerase
MVIIAPSILAADFSCLRDQVQAAEIVGAHWFHVDIMDGHFVPNLTFGPHIVEAMRKITSKQLDVHLMINNPDDHLAAFAKAGANRITVHAEVTPHLHKTISSIRELGVKPGVALNPATSASAIEEIIPDIDLVLAMTVNPGFGGQLLIQNVMPKVSRIRAMIASIGRQLHVQVDGGVDVDTVAMVVDAGADVLVAGSSVFGAPDIGEAYLALERTANF